MSWDTEFIWDSPIRPARDKQAIHSAIATIKAGGGTDGYPRAQESYQVLFDRSALLKHVIFLSDGQMTRGDFSGLIRRMAKDKITVSTVAIGKDADAQLMFDIAKWGRGRFYYTEDDTTIPRIFTLGDAARVEGVAGGAAVQGGGGSPAHEAIQDIDWKSAPPLGGYVATSLKGTADMVLLTHQEDPLLATWRYGLGRTGGLHVGRAKRSGPCCGCAGAASASSGPSSRAGRCARGRAATPWPRCSASTTPARSWWTRWIPRGSSSTSSTPRWAW